MIYRTSSWGFETNFITGHHLVGSNGRPMEQDHHVIFRLEASVPNSWNISPLDGQSLRTLSQSANVRPSIIGHYRL